MCITCNNMEYTKIDGFPSQRLKFNSKTKSWRKKCVDWADNRSYITSELVRKTVYSKKINYDLLRGILHMSDLELIINPDNIHAGYIPEKIQHYPIMNSKLNVLKGEESARGFNYRVIITNPTSISEIEKNKQQEVFARLQQLIADNSMSDEDFQKAMEEMGDYFTYDWQDTRELRANYLINHYSKEQNFPIIFNDGFWDAMAVGEEIYQCDIVGGEPIMEKLNTIITRVYRSGNSPKIEDADVIAIEDYWNLGKIVDRYYDELTQKDIKHLEELAFNTDSVVDEMDNIDPRAGLVRAATVDLNTVEGFFDNYSDLLSSQLPADNNGNIRVLRVYWKSLRAIKEVKSYDPQTGEEKFTFYDDSYVINEEMGEEEKLFWVNQAWEGTKIGDNIYVNMRPKPVQYLSMSNISKCHFGIIGTIYSINGESPYSLVDMMKPYNYLYDVIHDRLEKTIANNWGSIMELDLAQVPEGWDIEKWMYFARVNRLSVKDSFKEANKGLGTGKLNAGMYANNSRGILSTNDGNFIQQMINLLEFTKQEMGEVSGINRQREGQVQNRETVGGIERATLQSSHITEWLFTKHSDTKRRAIECFLETAKIALKGTNKKFPYILPDNSRILVEIDGDEFAENDYGLVVDDSENTEAFKQKIEGLAQAALQNQTLSFGTIMKLWSSCSVAEKTRMIERDEQAMMQRAEQARQQEAQQQMQMAQMQQEQAAAELQAKDEMNMRDNETKIVVATIGAQNIEDGIQEPESQLDRDKLQESIRQFDEKIRLEREKYHTDTRLKERDLSIKAKKASQPKSSSK